MKERFVSFLERHSLIFSFIGVTALFWVVLVPLIPDEINREFWLRASVFVMLVVCATWAPITFTIFRHNRTDGASMLILSISMVSWILLESRAFSYLNFFLGRPEWLYNSAYPAFIAFQVSMVGILILIAVWRQQQEDNALPGTYLTRLAVGIFLGGVAVGMLGTTILDFVF